ncbi:heavy metal translocating P-type ATPase [Marinisporobacter balticus]|uniref:Cd(2+)-exporting ATPase n=1 Tax=Marinisporobacter balticus TaxID=2018667 RepID=A0A4R2KDC0_9FIRM|nr:heavy metal translocating P-type ATPase [Marinisporobacter balticus]TCO68256.1 Cd2+/Zn2+-exporting ATPase [Marinisporobacter balticus]
MVLNNKVKDHHNNGCGMKEVVHSHENYTQEDMREYSDEEESHSYCSNHENTIKIELFIEGLHCSNCASKIERQVNALEEVEHATLNFATSTITIEMKKEEQHIVIEKASKIAIDVEPGVRVKEKGGIQKNKTEELEDKKKDNNRLLKRMGFSLAALAIAMFFKENTWGIASFIIGYLIIGADIIKRSISNIKRGEIFDENFLMTIATFAAIGVGEYPEAIMVMLLYQVGEYFEGRAVASSRKSIAKLMDIRPEYANLKIGKQIKKVSPDEVCVGEIIIVKPGEKVPLDGVVIEGTSSVDTKALTGEAVPQDLEDGDEITSGCINIDGVLTVKVTKAFKESAVSKILDLVQNASAKKAKTELSVTKFAKYYTPTVVFIAIIIAMIPPLFMKGQSFSDWILRGATFLVVSCPCALVISIPMSYFAGLGAASKNGVLVKGGNYLEALSKAGVMVFDKTGTLTEGQFKVYDIITTNGIDKETLVKFTAYVESFSTHPIAVSIVKEYGRETNKENIKNYKETRGKGVEADVEGMHIASGNSTFLKEKGIDIKESEEAGTIVYTAIDGKYAGYIIIKDIIKKDAKAAVEGLYQLGMNSIVMLTGDRKVTAHTVAHELGIENYKYGLLPNQKVEEVEILMKHKGEKKLVFVGDGINDAPVLARADVGVAMGGVGSDAAIEAADVVIMNDEPSKLIYAIKIAKATKNIVRQNIFLSISVKLGIMILAFFGRAPMWLAIFGDVGVSILAVFNAMRILKK